MNANILKMIKKNKQSSNFDFQTYFEELKESRSKKADPKKKAKRKTAQTSRRANRR